MREITVFSLANQCMRRKTVQTEASKQNSSESGVKASTICISAVFWFPLNYIYRQLPSVGLELFPFTQVQNVRAIWRLNVMRCIENASF